MPHKQHYGPDGTRWPSVTEVFDSALELIDREDKGLNEWYGRLGIKKCNEIKQAAADFGTKVHAGIDCLLVAREQEPVLDEAQWQLATAAIQWMKDSNFIFMHSERTVRNETEKYGGTADVVGYFKDRPDCLYVGDWKTSARMSKTFPMQLAGYARAIGAEIDNGFVLRLDKKTGKVEFKEYTELQTFYWPLFKDALNLWRYLNEFGIATGDEVSGKGMVSNPSKAKIKRTRDK